MGKKPKGLGAKEDSVRILKSRINILNMCKWNCQGASRVNFRLLS